MNMDGRNEKGRIPCSSRLKDHLYWVRVLHTDDLNIDSPERLF